MGFPVLASLFVICMVVLSGCASPSGPNSDSQNETAPANAPPEAFSACVNSCRHTLEAGDFDALERGPCLLDPIPVQPDWVCDIAHNPRQEKDNLPENQCLSFRSGQATHFIELSPECGLIRAV